METVAQQAVSLLVAALQGIGQGVAEGAGSTLFRNRDRLSHALHRVLRGTVGPGGVDAESLLTRLEHSPSDNRLRNEVVVAVLSQLRSQPELRHYLSSVVDDMNTYIQYGPQSALVKNSPGAVTNLNQQYSTNFYNASEPTILERLLTALTSASLTAGISLLIALVSAWLVASRGTAGAPDSEHDALPIIVIIATGVFAAWFVGNFRHGRGSGLLAALLCLLSMLAGAEFFDQFV